MEKNRSLESTQQSDWIVLQTDPAVAVQRPTRQHLRLWSLVLTSRGIPHLLENSRPEWCLLVPEGHQAEALSEIRTFEEQNRNWPPPAPSPHPHTENLLASLSVLILLAIFHNLVQTDILVLNGTVPDWLQLGMVQSGKIKDGEWWRLVTALTLHGDLQHLLGNLCIGGVFVILLCRQLGSGPAWTMLLGAGILGNLANVMLQPPAHNSVGASTAVFGAIGVLAAISMVRYRHHSFRRWPLPVAAAVALLAILGTEGDNTDLGAHLFGFLAGNLLGVLVECLHIRYGYPGRRLNLLLAFFSVMLVVTAWWYALAEVHL